MITLKQINKAINNTIKSALVKSEFKDIDIISLDSKEAFEKESDGSYINVIRPSIKITFDTTHSGKFNSQLKERVLPVRIYFFAKDRNQTKSDNLSMQDLLENAFLEDVKVTDMFYMPIAEDEEIQCSTTDGVLQVTFELYSLEEIYDDSNLEPVEELKFNLNLEE
ncbi:phage tail terminator family protein [Clostridium beijerinckii]|uniref:phage tail terminator family protein n=1 Tax=Clostridium beijerinckii TaxID=1520 RepID=UPI0014948925|nr:hypothetical protein [Clostridium beijerinckii]NOW07855.1 hypothetical protein [Clostridium beijerinckii]NYC05486.1 hypothetical protein [Clostridium beijerinckii]